MGLSAPEVRHPYRRRHTAPVGVCGQAGRPLRTLRIATRLPPTGDMGADSRRALVWCGTATLAPAAPAFLASSVLKFGLVASGLLHCPRVPVPASLAGGQGFGFRALSLGHCAA